MTAFRLFENSDPPELARLWNSGPVLGNRLANVTPRLLDEHPFGKLYFDPAGLWVAEAQSGPVGFAHAGFAPRADGGQLDDSVGAICQVHVAEIPGRGLIAGELIARCEAYLRDRGVRSLMAGGLPPVDPFYFGLYGGSRSAGLLSSDRETIDWFRAAGYRETGTVRIHQRALAGFRPPVDRQQLQWKRTCVVQTETDLPVVTWWEASTLGQRQRTRLTARMKSGAPRDAEVTFWDMQPLASGWGTRAAGLLHAAWDNAAWTDGLALFLLGDSLRQLQEQGIARVEAQFPDGDHRWPGILKSLGFEAVDSSLILTKESAA